MSEDFIALPSKHDKLFGIKVIVPSTEISGRDYFYRLMKEQANADKKSMFPITLKLKCGCLKVINNEFEMPEGNLECRHSNFFILYEYLD